MKIQVAKMGEPIIEGYKHIACSDNYINFMEISDNECNEILAQDILDSFDIDKIQECLVSLVGKLRLHGKIVLGGTDIRMFSRFVTSGSISEQDASSIVKGCNSMSSLSIIEPVLQSLGLNIVSKTINGLHFEVVAKRG